MGWFGPNLDCNCGCLCVDENTARIELTRRMGISQVNASGGPSFSSTVPDYRPPIPGGFVYNDFQPFDFSGTVSRTIVSSSASAFQIACPPFSSYDPITGTYGPGTMGANQTVTDSAGNTWARGFASWLKSLTSGPDCPDRPGASPSYWFEFVRFQGSVGFRCVDGVPGYILGVSTTLILFQTQSLSAPTWPAYPTAGVNWTVAGSPSITGTPFGNAIYTKIGTTTDEGAVFTLRNLGIFGSTQYVYELSSTTWMSYPNTSVSMWTPNPLIDWTGLTLGGTATLS